MLERLPISSSRWKRSYPATSLSSGIYGTFMATSWPVFRSRALKMHAMPLRRRTR